MTIFCLLLCYTLKLKTIKTYYNNTTQYLLKNVTNAQTVKTEQKNKQNDDYIYEQKPGSNKVTTFIFTTRKPHQAV